MMKDRSGNDGGQENVGGLRRKAANDNLSPEPTSGQAVAARR